MSANDLYLTTEEDLTTVADAIRTRGGTSAALEYPDGFASAIAAIPGSATVDEDADVLFIDYDGTPVAGRTKAQINAMTSDSDLPENPSHEGLTAQGWNWTVAQLKAQLLDMPDQQIIVGQMYTTVSEATEIDVELEEKTKSPVIRIYVNGTVTIDWGDSTTADTLTGTTGNKKIQHTYQNTGNYTIKIKATEGTYKFELDSSVCILGGDIDNTTIADRAYAGTIKKVRLGKNIEEIGTYAFQYCTQLESITIPSTISLISDHAFFYCTNLKSITIPKGILNILGYTAQYCTSLEIVSIPNSTMYFFNHAFSYACIRKITIPSGAQLGASMLAYNRSFKKIELKSATIASSVLTYDNALSEVKLHSGVTSIENSAFSNCTSLKNIEIPNGVTSLGNNCFSSCYNLTKITIPATVTSIGNSVFASCNALKEFHFLRSESVPSLGSTVFSTQSGLVIYVPYSADHSVLNAYKTANNWSTYADYMQEEPQS